MSENQDENQCEGENCSWRDCEIHGCHKNGDCADAYNCDTCMDNYWKHMTMNGKIIEWRSTLYEYLKNHSVRDTYNHFTRQGIEIEKDNDYSLFLEVHYQYKELYLTIMKYEDDFFKRYKVNEFSISK